MDFSSLYPSIIQAFNLSPSSQVGKFFFVDPEVKQRLIELGFGSMFQESSNGKKTTEIPDDETDLGPALSDFIQSSDFARIGTVFMDLPSTEDMIKEIKAKHSA